MLIVIIIVIITFAIINTIYVSNYKSSRNYRYKLEIENEGNTLNRDIDVIYSPSIVSYLYNQAIEIEKDLTSDILNLYARKIINISKDKKNNKCILKLNEKMYKELYLSNQLLENDRYIIDTIVLKKFDFKYEEWQDKIKKVYKEHIMQNQNGEGNLQKLINKHPMFYYVGIPLLLVLLFAILAPIFDKDIIEGIITGTVLGFFIIMINILIQNVINREENIDMYLTESAKNELKKWIRFKKFIEEYTLLKEKRLEEIILYERYIPYAMVLDVNKKYSEELLKILNKEEIKIIYDSIREYKEINNVFIEYFSN